MAELKFSRQEGSIGEYHEWFDAIINKLDLTVDYTLNCFLEGLYSRIKQAVRMFKLTTLPEAYSLAKLQEDTNVIPSKSTSRRIPQPSSQQLAQITSRTYQTPSYHI